jgi:hypothetical protein
MKTGFGAEVWLIGSMRKNVIGYVPAVQRDHGNGNANNQDDDNNDEDSGGEGIGLAEVGLHDPLVGSMRNGNFQVTGDGNQSGLAGAKTEGLVLLEVNGLKAVLCDFIPKPTTL